MITGRFFVNQYLKDRFTYMNNIRCFCCICVETTEISRSTSSFRMHLAGTTKNMRSVIHLLRHFGLKY